MQRATVVSLDHRRDRSRRVARATAARRRLEEVDRRGRTRRGGRAWLNGAELGGGSPSLQHLTESYD